MIKVPQSRGNCGTFAQAVIRAGCTNDGKSAVNVLPCCTSQILLGPLQWPCPFSNCASSDMYVVWGQGSNVILPHHAVGAYYKPFDQRSKRHRPQLGRLFGFLPALRTAAGLNYCSYRLCDTACAACSCANPIVFLLPLRIFPGDGKNTCLAARHCKQSTVSQRAPLTSGLCTRLHRQIQHLFTIIRALHQSCGRGLLTRGLPSTAVVKLEWTITWHSLNLNIVQGCPVCMCRHLYAR